MPIQPKKNACPGREGRDLTRAKVEAVSALRAEGCKLGSLLECAGLARSSYYYALSHPARPTRPELRDAVAEIFSRTAVSVNIFFTIFTNVFSPIAPTRMRRIRQRGCAAFGV